MPSKSLREKVEPLIDRLPLAKKNYQAKLERMRKEIVESIKRNEYATDEEAEVRAYLEKNSLCVFPYSFVGKYKLDGITVFFDEQSGLHYVVHLGRKLFFRKEMTQEQIREKYNSLLIEQDRESPHRYMSEQVRVEREVVADVGAAEAMFSLDVIDRAKKVIIFERDSSWMQPLEMTFSPWKGKVELVNKTAGNANDMDHVRLDSFPEINLLKIDVEGSEEEVMRGAEGLLGSDSCRTVLACTYHRQGDAQKIGDLLNAKGFHTSYSRGYMIYYMDRNIALPYLRRGLIIGKKY